MAGMVKQTFLGQIPLAKLPNVISTRKYKGLWFNGSKPSVQHF